MRYPGWWAVLGGRGHGWPWLGGAWLRRTAPSGRGSDRCHWAAPDGAHGRPSKCPPRAAPLTELRKPFSVREPNGLPALSCATRGLTCMYDALVLIAVSDPLGMATCMTGGAAVTCSVADNTLR